MAKGSGVSTPKENLSKRRGPKAERGEVADDILRAARTLFAEHGYAGTSLRAVATKAGVDPALISYYFGDKTTLLTAAVEPPPSLPLAVAGAVTAPLSGRGRALVEAMLGQWDDPIAGEVLRSIILTAAHEPVAMDRLRLVFETVILAGMSESLADDEREVRASLVASQLAGLAMVRYVWRVGALADLSSAEVADLLAPNLQRAFTGKL